MGQLAKDCFSGAPCDHIGSDCDLVMVDATASALCDSPRARKSVYHLDWNKRRFNRDFRLYGAGPHKLSGHNDRMARQLTQ